MLLPRACRRCQVAVLIESSVAYGRGLIEGVVRYNREHGDWYICSEPRGLDGPPLWLSTWKGDGILARCSNRALAKALLATGVPVLDLYGRLADTGLPFVGGDNTHVARLAFEHLWEAGLRQFGYCGLRPGKNRYLDERQEAFRGLAKAAGCPCSVFASPIVGVTVPDWKQALDREIAWLKELPKPAGILACCDEAGYRILDACHRAGLRVPEEVAVIGVGNDSTLCDLSHPPLTSVEHDSIRIGYEAANLLDKLMRGGRLPRQPVRIAPRQLVIRRSTDILAIEDPDVIAALRYIRSHVCEGIRIKDVLRQVSVSQCVLEQKFSHFLGRSPKAELLRVQIERVRELLTESDLPLKVVAKRCGFSSEKYLSEVFLRQCGVRPITYRKRHQWMGGQGR